MELIESTGPWVVLDSITKLASAHRGRVVIAGSHGGTYAGYCAARGGVRAVIFNDAGVGRDAAGIAALPYLQQWGVAAAAVDYRSARIGDGADMARNGVISYVNALAAALGCVAGQTVAECAAQLCAAPLASATPAEAYESRLLLPVPQGGSAIGLDSVSLLEPGDTGAIAVTASHGEMLASTGSDGVGPAVFMVSFSDAGLGKDGAGASRLGSLQARGIAGLTVSAYSARIGSARSCYEDGVISCANARARELGARPGTPIKPFIDALATGRHNRQEQEKNG
ncbi:MAG TPA: hypothetical protein VEA17_08085 [Bordetella sp.]|nr:hypothetical protein [Bordetella sp.]